MKVADLIEYLENQQGDMLVAIEMFSEQCLLEVGEIKVKELCEPRPDGWIQNKRSDKPTRLYLVFPGN